MKRLRFGKKRNRNLRKNIDPNRLKDDNDDPKAYLKELAGLATILGAGATGATILPNDRVYAAKTSVDPKSQIVGSVGSVSDVAQSGASNRADSKSNGKDFSISNSEAKSISTSNSKSLLISQSTSMSLSQSISQSTSHSQSISHSLSQSESLLSSLSLSKNKEKEQKSNTKKTSPSSHSNKENKHSQTIKEEKNASTNFNNANSQNASNSLNSNDSQESNNSTVNSESTSLSLSTDLFSSTVLSTGALTTNLLSPSTTHKEVDNKQLDNEKIDAKIKNLAFNNVFLANNGLTVDVNNASEFLKAFKNNDVSVINLNNNIDFGNSSAINNVQRRNSIAINGTNSGSTINFGNSRLFLTSYVNTDNTEISFNNLNIFSANSYGAVEIRNTGSNHLSVVYNNVNATGGTAIASDTGYDTANKTFEVRGNTTITAVPSYTYNGRTYKTGFLSVHGSNEKTLIYTAFNFKVDPNAHVVIDGNNIVNNNIALLGNHDVHTVDVGENATLVLKNTTDSNIFIPDYDGGNSVINVEKNANVTMSTSGTNIKLNSYNHIGNVNNTININDGATVTLNGATNISVGNGSVSAVVNIDNPNRVTLNNDGGKAYIVQGESGWFPSGLGITVNARNTNIEAGGNFTSCSFRHD